MTYGLERKRTIQLNNHNKPISYHITTHSTEPAKTTPPTIQTQTMAFPLDYYFGPAPYHSDLPPPLVDHLHERPHPHQSLLSYLTHRKPHRQPIINQPDLDLRDHNSEYIVDVELPGLTDKNAIKIEWTSSRSLLIAGTIDRPFVPDDLPAPAPATEEGGEKPEGEKSGAEAGSEPDPESRKATLLVAERKVGSFRRHLHFPVDVEMEKLKARLESGLLTIRVPKKAMVAGSGARITVE